MQSRVIRYTFFDAGAVPAISTSFEYIKNSQVIESFLFLLIFYFNLYTAIKFTPYFLIFIDTLDIMELDDDRIRSLQRFVDSNICTIHGSATEIDTVLTDGSIDILISTLPLGSLPLPLVHEILGQIQKVLKTGGVFIQYQYWMVNKKDIKKYFTIEKIAFEPRNFSPAYIYVSKK